MNEKHNALPDRIVFIADAHLGLPGDNPRRAEKIEEFLRWLQGKISHLYIVGDLFDFWFEYGSVIPTIAPRVIFELYNLAQSGTKVTIFAGNHDYWFGSYLIDNVGLTVVKNDLVVEHQGLKIYLHHGDGLFPFDHGYRLLKKLLRNKIAISLFRSLHPDIGRWLAQITSKTSREYLAPTPGKEGYYESLFRDIADARLKDGYDAVIYGHAHVPLIEQRQGGKLILLGDWLKHDTYVTLEHGEFSLKKWQSDTSNK